MKPGVTPAYRHVTNFSNILEKNFNFHHGQLADFTFDRERFETTEKAKTGREEQNQECHF